MRKPPVPTRPPSNNVPRMFDKWVGVAERAAEELTKAKEVQLHDECAENFQVHHEKNTAINAHIAAHIAPRKDPPLGCPLRASNA